MAGVGEGAVLSTAPTPKVRLVSSNGWWSAMLWDTEDGVAVEIWKRSRGGMYALDHRDVIDAPFHVVCDLVFAMLNQLPLPRMSQGSQHVP
jgi:hypothetical protein